LRKPSEDEMEDYRQQDAEDRYERSQKRKLSDEVERQRRDPGYVPSWERD
jgi:hypothetical protein